MRVTELVKSRVREKVLSIIFEQGDVIYADYPYISDGSYCIDVSKTGEYSKIKLTFNNPDVKTAWNDKLAFTYLSQVKLLDKGSNGISRMMDNIRKQSYCRKLNDILMTPISVDKSRFFIVQGKAGVMGCKYEWLLKMGDNYVGEDTRSPICIRNEQQEVVAVVMPELMGYSEWCQEVARMLTER